MSSYIQVRVWLVINQRRMHYCQITQINYNKFKVFICDWKIDNDYVMAELILIMVSMEN